MASPFDKSKEKKKEEVNASSFSPSSAPEIEKVPVKEPELKDEKMVQVETLTDLPSYNGKRYPKGKQLMVPEVAFNANLMKKI